MLILEDTKFAPQVDASGAIISYQSLLSIEVGGEVFTVVKILTPSEYDNSYYMLREYLHKTLRDEVMALLKKRIFGPKIKRVINDE